MNIRHQKNSRSAMGAGCRWIGLALCAGLLAVFLGQAAGAAEAPEPYREQWKLEMAEEARLHLLLEMSAVDVEVVPFEGAHLEIELDATRKPSSNGELPEVTLESTEETVALKEIYPKQGKIPFLGSWTSGELQGTLTIRIPSGRSLAELSIESFSGSVFVEKASAAMLYISSSSGDIRAKGCTVEYGASLETFSGALGVADLRAESLHLASSSGGIRMRRIVASELCMAEGFSGKLDILDMETGALELGSSSGDIAMEKVRAASVAVNTFSGAVSAKDLIVEGDVEITGSSGAIFLQALSARSLETEQFSGALDFEDIRLSENVRMTSSSGDLEGTGLEAVTVEMETFSGGISIAEASVDALDATTSSGSCAIWLTREAEVTLTAFSGDITLGLPQDCSFDYAIETFSGRIDFGFAPTLEDAATLGALVGRVGEGGLPIRIDTSSGAITVLAREE